MFTQKSANVYRNIIHNYQTLEATKMSLKGWVDLCEGFPGGSDVKEPVYNAEDSSSIHGLGRSPGEGNGNPLQYSCLEKLSAKNRSLTGYNPWGRKSQKRLSD